MVQANQRIGEYVLQEKVGGGAFGEVWRAAHHVWVDQFVAIKIPTDPQYLRNLQSEGVAIHGLVHPNIVRAMGFDPYAPVPYLTMEYVPGTSLRPLIQKKNLSTADAVAILRQILSGLKYAHEHGVIHRDIKPENILIHERALKEGFAADGVVKITDFGLGKAAGVAAGSIAYSASMNNPAGRDIAGTLDYMAPEQRSGGDVDGRVDLYATGVVLYEMLTGERPAGTDLPSDVNKSVPKYMDDLFRRSYARLDKRFASADQFLAALPPAGMKVAGTGALGGIGMPGATTISGVPIPPLPRVTPMTGRPSTCPQCRQPIDGGDQFCIHCGVQLVDVVRRCTRCGAYPDRTDRYCIFCGETLSAQPAVI
jgi:serine/threonine protein kinase